MFGYVTPCKMEMKMKDYEKFRAYYCGLCRSIKNSFGNLPRVALNYDMTFLGVLLDSLEDKKCRIVVSRCLVHPFKKRLIILDNRALNYAAACNVILAYYKLLDNAVDDGSITSRVASIIFKKYLNKQSRVDFNELSAYIKNSLEKLSSLEIKKAITLDEVCHPFADLTGYIISSYINSLDTIEDVDITRENLYWLGYNLGKWIYVIDAWDDLEKDMHNNKLNILNNIYNRSQLSPEDLKKSIEERIDFLLVTCASSTLDYLNKLPLKKNQELLYNILQFGLMEKMEIVFKRSGDKDAESL
jgi:hypothetical protein